MTATATFTDLGPAAPLSKITLTTAAGTTVLTPQLLGPELSASGCDGHQYTLLKLAGWVLLISAGGQPTATTTSARPGGGMGYRITLAGIQAARLPPRLSL